MVYDHECGIYLILWFLEANTHSRYISFVKEVGGITQIFYLFLIVGSSWTPRTSVEWELNICATHRTKY